MFLILGSRPEGCGFMRVGFPGEPGEPKGMQVQTQNFSSSIAWSQWSPLLHDNHLVSSKIVLFSLKT